MSVFPVLLVATLAIILPGVPPVAGQLGLPGLLDSVTGLLNGTVGDLVKLVNGLVNNLLSSLLDSISAQVTSVLSNPSLNASQIACVAKATTAVLSGVNNTVPKLLTTVTGLPSNTLKALLSGGSLNELLPTGVVTTLTADLLANTKSSLLKCIA